MQLTKCNNIKYTHNKQQQQQQLQSKAINFKQVAKNVYLAFYLFKLNLNLNNPFCD